MDDPRPKAEPASETVQRAASSLRRVLFVDDEPAVLEGLRAALRPQRREWEMVFALGGVGALEQVRQTTFDVVVTDLHMPDLDGSELLKHVKQLQPQAVRIVLSALTDTQASLRTLLVAHQYLAKPCDIPQLKAVVSRACQLNDLLRSDELRPLAGDVSTLPAAPRCYLTLLETLANPNCSIPQLARVIEGEPALCAKLLQVANSAFFGLPRAVTSISHAASYLGTSALKNLVLAMETMNRAPAGVSLKALKAFRTNALLTALLGRHWFAGQPRDADSAFVAGMLRDSGHLILAAENEGPHPEAPDMHAELGAYLLGLWGIPHPVLEAVAFHEHPERVPHQGLEVVDVVHLADRVAAELAPSPFQPAPSPLDEKRLTELGVTAEQLSSFRSAAKKALLEARGLVGK